jgi:hydrogenase maturation protein HypF
MYLRPELTADVLEAMRESDNRGGALALGVVRSLVKVDGIVQGVGFRPFVHQLACDLSLSGLVGNDATGVFIEVEGDARAVCTFVTRLQSEAPPLAVIERIEALALAPSGAMGFAIVESGAAGERRALVSPDTATCPDCLGELWDPSNRRYRYPFINCTNCGPRFTIVRGVPYDRPNTTMAGFRMCPDCRREYEDPADRRFHAQPNCCAACGPSLSLLDPSGGPLSAPGGALKAAAGVLEQGGVIAVKGLGGYHLAVLASCGLATAALRARKHRADKPFAVMVAGTETARALCEVSSAEQGLLEGADRPIVLLRRRAVPDQASPPMAPSVAPGDGYLGVMLPYTPLHHLLAARLGQPFVLTSGNVSDEPITYLDHEARARLSGIADAFLAHDRPIHMRADDSVVRVVRGLGVVVRRSRGLAPRPIRVGQAFRRPILACGAELKNTFCVAKGDHAFISPHIGDLENYEALRSYTEGIEHFCRLFDIRPEIVAHDLHPEYLSTKYALEWAPGVDLVAVQHHHAHIASCLVDNGEVGPVIGVAFDGLGLGEDGSLWGGEVLIAGLTGFRRVGHLEPLALPGGTAAIRQPWRMAAAYLDAAFDGAVPEELGIMARHRDQWAAVVRLAHSGLASPLTSSAGRLFDAVSAIVCGRDAVNYEGQAAIELERVADPFERSWYPVPLVGDGNFQLIGKDVVRAVAEDVLAGAEPSVISARFHNGLVRAVVEACRRASELSDGLVTVALSGGVFQNVILASGAAAALEDAGFRVLVHSRVPTNDGGISLGQAAIAGARDADMP